MISQHFRNMALPSPAELGAREQLDYDGGSPFTHRGGRFPSLVYRGGLIP